MVVSVVVAMEKVATGVEVAMPAFLLVESTVNTALPPFWMVRAVVEEIFISSPPAAVKEERNVDEEF